jgi:hypothetical protein
MQKVILCKKCHRTLEMAGYQRGDPVSLTVTCPYSDCREPNETLWPIEHSFSVKVISPKK